MEIVFSNGDAFPLITAFSRVGEVSSISDFINTTNRNILELHFGSEYVSINDIEKYFSNLDETASVIKIIEEEQIYIYNDYIIPIRCSKEYFEGSANPRIIVTLGQLNETDKTLRDIAPKKVYTGTALEITKAKKIDELDRLCNKHICEGTDVLLSTGLTEHFTLDEHDQLNLSGIALKILMGNETISWHNSDKESSCKFYSVEDAKTIISTLTSFKEYHITYFRDLRIYINTLITEEEVNNIEYGFVLPDNFKSDVLKSYNIFNSKV